MSRPIRPSRLFLVAATLAAALSLVAVAHAGSFRERIAERLAVRRGSDAMTGRMAPATVPPGVRVLRDIPYGDDPHQRLDVYVPEHGASRAPVVFMVHGGGWKRGDKDMDSVVTNKVARWVPRGIVFVSIDYRMLPEANPQVQAQDVARALAYVQRHASAWGGDGERTMLMGHSAGAHLVSLIEASPGWAAQAGASPWLGAVSLDSGALDVPALMQPPHMPLYDEAFGSDPTFWRAVSPQQQLAPRRPPLLAVCSTRRTRSCDQSSAFVDSANASGTRAALLREDLSHREINDELGKPGAYTDAVEAFMATLDPDLAHRLH
ncbi:MAG: alpha/beta hydrolase [Lysobacter sp.]|nr:alpha/beta hydrolase [Lysobacter sp.]